MDGEDFVDCIRAALSPNAGLKYQRLHKSASLTRYPSRDLKHHKKVCKFVMDTYAAIVLAAGKGTRMRSTLPKVLHQVAGLPLLAHVLNAIDAISSTSAFAPLQTTISGHRPIVVLGHEADQVEASFGERCLYALQEEQSGTGHAVLK